MIYEMMWQVKGGGIGPEVGSLPARRVLRRGWVSVWGHGPCCCSWRFLLTLGPVRARCIHGDLEWGTALTALFLTLVRTKRAALNGPVKPLQPKVQLVAQIVEQKLEALLAAVTRW